MLTKVKHYEKTKKKEKMEFQYSHEPFNISYAIDCFIAYLNSNSMIEIKEKRAIQRQCTDE